MKSFSLILSFLLIVSIGRAQAPVTDTHPNVNIFVVDYQSGRESLATTEGAILFKDAFVDLVNGTDPGLQRQFRMSPGRKTVVIKQINPNVSNGYQLTMQTTMLGQTSVLYSFLYNTDQNTLSVYDQGLRNWRIVPVTGDNNYNLNSCITYGRFNDPNGNVNQAPDLSANNNQQAPDLSTDDDTPVDTAVSVATEPPALPDYEQPECPVDGYLWQPGYWAYSLNDQDYYWVPGVWVAPPRVGFLWTPSYWGFVGARYIFHVGYWGPTIGFYGGINYGYGYGGVGFVGGEWRNGGFRYNTAVVRVNTSIVHNTYIDEKVVYHGTVNHASFNGRGGIVARPNDREMAAMHQEHIRSTSEQIRNQRVARVDKSQFASANHGKPSSFARDRAPAATPRTNNTNQRNNQNPGNQRNNQNPSNPANQRNNQNPSNPANQRNNNNPNQNNRNNQNNKRNQRQKPPRQPKNEKPPKN